MPIEIKELHIKINVEEGSNSKETISTGNNSKSKKDKTNIISECVEAVMELLEQQKER